MWYNKYECTVCIFVDMPSKKIDGGKQMSNIKEVLYKEFGGIFERMQFGDYTISDEEWNAIIDFAEEINNKLKNGQQCTTEEVSIAIDIVYSMGQITREKWPARLADEVYKTLLRGINYTN